MPPSQSPKQNRMLAALSLADYTHLLPLLELVTMPAGYVIYEIGLPIRYLYFPTTCIVTRLYETENGACTQIGIIGNEGFADISALFGGENSHARLVVQNTGEAYRIKASLLKNEFEKGVELRHLLLRFAHALMVQTEQIAVSNRYHTVDQQLACFLLMSLDRLSGDELHITHEQAGIMLGVRRESITVAANKLQMTGAIHCRRGHIAIADRQQLEASAGENYQIVKEEYELLQETYVSSATRFGRSPEKQFKRFFQPIE
ncbi:MAG: Crp/Fnr family transcriptional regulator [Nitrosospira sp.]